MTETHTISAKDLPAVAQLLNDTFRSGVTDQDVLTDFPLYFTPDNFPNCRVVVVDGKIVSHAGIFACELMVDGQCFKTGVIVLVATHSDHRHQGHAARLMRELQQMMCDDDYDLGILWTGVPEFYEKLGWEVVTPRGWMFDDLRDVQQSLLELDSAQGRIVPYDAQRQLDGIIELHEREPVRTVRSREEFQALLSLPKIHVFVLERDQQVAAYLVAADAKNKRGLIEYGGAATEILSLASHTLQSDILQGPLPLLIYHAHSDIAESLLGVGVSLDPLECSKGRGYEMIFNVRTDPIPSRARKEIFSWGLDFT